MGSLLETIVVAALLSVATAAILGAFLGSARVVATPVVRDATLAVARNAAAEARAATAYDPAAADAILHAAPATWNSGATQFSSTAENGALLLAAQSANETVRLRVSVAPEALPQGAIVDTNGNLVRP